MPTSLGRHEEAELPNRPDEWKIEQGLHGASLPILDQTGSEVRYVKPFEYKPWIDQAAIDALGDRNKLFAEEREGWDGYVEWEKYDEKKAIAHKILTSQNASKPSSYVRDGRLTQISVPATT